MTSSPRSRRPTSRSVVRVAFSVEPSTSASGCLVPCRSMPSATTQTGLGEVHPADHHRDQVQSAQVGAEQLGESGLGLRHELRDTADLLVLVATSLICCPTGSRPIW